MGTAKLLHRRTVLVGLPACAMAVFVDEAVAGAVYPVSLGELVLGSRHVLVGIPREASSQWIGTGDTRRLVTYSRVEVLQSIDGRPPEDTNVFIRTLGGRSGDIGQIVHGEAELALERPSVLFLRDVESGVFAVTGMAQGHFPLRDDDTGTPRLQLSPRLSDFVTKDANCAVSRLRGRSVEACESLVLEELH